MKKIIIWVILIVLIPFLIVIFPSNKEAELEFKSKVNNFVKVKRLKTEEIEKVNLEDYVIGVLAGEMPIYFELEALKAQAVAARSYVMTRIKKDNEYDVVDSVLNQVYLDTNYLKKTWKENYETNISKLKQAVKETEGEYLEYNGKIADTLFFSTSNGYTENVASVFKVELPYLSSVESSWDSKTNPNFEYKKELTLEEFFKKINLDYNKTLTVTNISRNNTNRVEKITINGKEFTGRELYTLLSLRSTDFILEQNNNKVVITTKGHGHGVGMSQYGALGMAKEGYTYDKILNHYYKDTKLKKIV